MYIWSFLFKKYVYILLRMYGNTNREYNVYYTRCTVFFTFFFTLQIS